MAPTCGSAHGTTAPTARNFDCVATPHCCASGSHAAIEYVATGRALAIGQLTQVEVEQLALRLGDEDGRDLWPLQRRHDLLRRVGADDDGSPFGVRGSKLGLVRHVVEHE